MPQRSDPAIPRLVMRQICGNAPRLAVVACAGLALAMPAHAYVGPGAGLSAIGIVVGLISAVLLGIVGFIWYPIKRLLKLRRERAPEAQAEAASAVPPPPKEP